METVRNSDNHAGDCQHGDRKRRRLFEAEHPCGDDDDESPSDPRRHPVFVEFHLKLLKSLYPKNDERSRPGNGGTSIETKTSQAKDYSWIDPSIWAMIDKFLESRHQLFEAKTEAARWQGIHEEALLFAKGDCRTPSSFSRPIVALPTAREFHESALVTAFSPSTRRHCSPTLSLHPMIHPRGDPSATSPTGKDKSPVGGKCFQLVADLLCREKIQAEKAFHQSARPHEPLLGLCEDHVALLKDRLQESHRAMIDADQKRISELLSVNTYAKRSAQPDSPSEKHMFKVSPEKVDMVDIETRIRLWTTLITDLRNLS